MSPTLSEGLERRHTIQERFQNIVQLVLGRWDTQSGEMTLASVFDKTLAIYQEQMKEGTFKLDDDDILWLREDWINIHAEENLQFLAKKAKSLGFPSLRRVARETAVKPAETVEEKFTGVVDLAQLQLYDAGKFKPFEKFTTKSKIPNKSGKLLFKLTVNGEEIFWKEAKENRQNQIRIEEIREVAGANIANYITQGLVPKAHIRKVEGKVGIGQELLTFEHFSGPTDPRLDQLNPKQVAQILAHFIADKMCSNYDCHFDNFGIDKQGNIIGIDKGEAFKFYKRGKLGFGEKDTDAFDADKYGPDNINFYKAITDRIKDGRLQVNFDDPMILGALERCKTLTSQDIKKLYSPYAGVRWKGKETIMFHEALGRAQSISTEFLELQKKIKPTKASP
ncbi:MAG TPA: hypothetical protein VJ205_03495 [Gammaproteobacteria bacterium]|nr:hypothetical protein [Gammaproteobacteria bacterium]